MQLNVLNDLAEAMKALDGKKNSSTGVLVMLCKQVTRVDRPIQGELSRDDERVAVKVACPGSPSQ